MATPRSRSGWWLVLLAGATLGGGWWVLTRTSPTRSPALQGEGRETSPLSGPGEDEPGVAEVGRPKVPPVPLLQPTPDAGAVTVRSTQAIGGRIVLVDGAPAAGAEVWAEEDAPGRPVVARALAGADGAYRLEGLARGLYYVSARVAEGEAEQGAEGIVQAGTTDFDLTLVRRGPIVEVSVVDPDGAPVPAVRLLAWRDGASHDLGEVVAGRRRIEIGARQWGTPIPSLVGAYLVAYDPRDAQGRALALAPVRVGPLASDRGRVELRLAAGTLMRAHVVPPEGGSLEALRYEVTCLGPPAEQADEAARAAPKDGIPASFRRPVPEDGRIGIAALRLARPHTLRILTDDRDDLLEPPILVLRPGSEPAVIRLRASVDVVVIAEGPDGRRIAEIDVGLEGLEAATAGAERPPSGGTLIREDGAQVLQGLDPEALYRLRIVPREWAEARNPSRERYALADLAPHVELAWRPRDLTVRLALGLRIEGVVRDAAGTPVEAAYVREVGTYRTGSPRVAFSDAEGRFTLPGCLPGVYALAAWPPHVGDQHGVEDGAARGQVEAGRSVELTLPHRRRATLVLPEALRRIREQATGSKGLGIRVRRRTADGWALASRLNLRTVPVSLEVDCLREDVEYEFLAFPGDGGYWGARLGPQAIQTRMERHVGGAIRVVLANTPAGSEDVDVTASDDSIEHSRGDSEVQPDGSVLIRGLPEGVYTVTAQTYDPPRKAQAVARPGETVTLTLEPAPR